MHFIVEITPWFIGWMSKVTFGWKNFAKIFPSHDEISSRWHGVLPTKRTAFFGRPFFVATRSLVVQISYETTF